VAARAIEPFFTTKPLGKGTGMGLSQVYGLVQQSGGELVIRSEPDRGTTVSLYWPAIRVQDEAAIASLDNFSSDKALVVDDQPEVLETLAEMLRTMGYQVLTAAGAEEAMDILKREPGITVVLSDVVMPGMDGVSLGREARKLLTGVKIILASGFPRDNLQGHREGLDEFDFLMKPFRIAELAKVLRQPPTVSNY
jgi:CheY-like chemotaxis protein